MMQKPWLLAYPPGVPEFIDAGAVRSLGAMLDEAVDRYADRVAFIQMGRQLTYRELGEHSRAFGNWLLSAGLRKGDRIALMLPNTLQYPIALLGALRVGLVVVNTNPLYTAPELEHQLIDSGATAIVVLENFAHLIQKIRPRTRLGVVVVTGVGDLLGTLRRRLVNFVVRAVRRQVPPWHIVDAVAFQDALSTGQSLRVPLPTVEPEALAFLQYTGGTTGVSKGAMLSHRNIGANVLQVDAWFEPVFQDRPGVLITPIPLYHIFALMACIRFAHMGWTNVLITNPRDFTGTLAQIKRYPFAFISGVNTLFNAWMSTPGFAQLDFSRLKMTLGGGMAVQAAVAQRWKQMTGHVLTQGWGLTETSPAVCICLPGAPFNGSVGLPIPSTEVSVRDDEGHELPLGETGELCVRGPQVMLGYWQRPDETDLVLSGQGWLRTGDIGRISPTGHVFIEDRKKDLILVSGFNVYPNEVEAAASTLPGLLEVAAVALPDPHSGEVVALFVVSQDQSITGRQIIEHCRRSLASYKVPRQVYFRIELPKTNVGKILRKALREEVLRDRKMSAA